MALYTQYGYKYEEHVVNFHIADHLGMDTNIPHTAEEYYEERVTLFQNPHHVKNEMALYYGEKAKLDMGRSNRTYTFYRSKPLTDNIRCDELYKYLVESFAAERKISFEEGDFLCLTFEQIKEVEKRIPELNLLSLYDGTEGGNIFATWSLVSF